jgi:Tfp pilus assembly protein PilW
MGFGASVLPKQDLRTFDKQLLTKGVAMGIGTGNALKNEKGFTIVELLVSILVSMIVLAAVSAAFMVQNKSFADQEQVIDAQENARAAIQLMMKELLMAGYDPTGTAGAGILMADSDTVQFTMDIDGDGTATGIAGEDITYALDTSENQVTRETGGSGSQPIAENIQAISFSYFDSDGNQLTAVPLSSSDRAKVTRVSVEVTPKMPQSASFNHLMEQGDLVRLAKAGAVQVCAFVTEALVPSAQAQITSTQDNTTLKDSVAPPNLGKTRTGADAGLGNGTGYETAQDETWTEMGSSSSSSTSS